MPLKIFCSLCDEDYIEVGDEVEEDGMVTLYLRYDDEIDFVDGTFYLSLESITALRDHLTKLIQSQEQKDAST